MPKKKTYIEFVRDAVIVHDDKYDYSDVIYVGTDRKVTIGCPLHGKFEQTPHHHLGGSGCNECGKLSTKFKQNKGVEQFIIDSCELHGLKYNYDKVVYINNKTKLTITCPIHGDFEQTPNSHLRGYGCRKCNSTGYAFSDWKNNCPGNPGIFYIIRCWNDDEEFYKVGITCTDSVKHRYPNKRTMPYSFEIIKEVYNYDRRVIWNIEVDMKRLNKNNLYYPKMPFNGSMTECFTKIKYK